MEEENKELNKRITILENKLRGYENPHTPLSMQRFKGKACETNPPGKRGAPPGHYGATRDRPESDEIIPVTMDQCPQCGSYLGEDIGVESRTIEDLPPSQKIKVTQYQLHTYVCPGCNNTVTASHNKDCPRVGDFGIRLLTHITMMKFHQRGVLRRIPESLKEQYRFQDQSERNHDILLRVGKLLPLNMNGCFRGLKPPDGCIPMKPGCQSWERTNGYGSSGPTRMMYFLILGHHEEKRCWKKF